MSKAEKAKIAFEQKQAPSVIAAAKAQDAEVNVSHDDGMIFYRFDDNSILGTKGRARSHQLWLVTAANQ